MKRLVLIVPLLVSCTAVNSPDMHSPAPIEADDFCVEFSRVLCDAAIDCCSTETFDRPMCIASIGLFCTNTFAPLFSDPRTGYDAEEAGVLLALGRQLADTCDPQFRAWYNRSDGVFSAMLGTQPEGGGCNAIITENLMPRDGVSFVIDSPRFYQCEGDHSCQAVGDLSGPWMCAPQGGMGASCIGLAECEPDLTCRVVGAAASCAPRLPDGSPCRRAGNCDSYVCEMGMCRANDTPDQVFCNLLGD